MHYPRLLLAGLLTTLLSAPLCAPVRADEPLVAVAHSTPLHSLLARARLVGRQPADTKVSVVMVLPLRNQDQLQTFLQAVATPGSPLYGHYLTPAQFAGQYGPTQADYDTVVDYLKSQGLSVRLHAARTIVGVSGRSADVESAFHVHFNQYLTSDGRKAYANDAAPLIPRSVASRITGVVGLDNLVVPQTHFARRSFLAPQATGTPPLVGTDSSGGLTPTDIKRVYNLNTIGLQGEGQTIALAELDGYDSGDIRAYIQKFNLPIDPNNTDVLDNIYIDGFDGTPGTNQGEDVLDIDMVLALAPRAKRIFVYEAPNTNNGDFVEMFQQIADDDFAQTVSASVGIDVLSLQSELSTSQYTALIQAESAAFQQMGAQGQSIFVASGDTGAYAAEQNPSDTAAQMTTICVQDPAQNPNVTAVGGTTIFPNNSGTAALSYGYENTWGTYPDTVGGPGDPGSGGGFSTIFPKPYYQYRSFSLTDPTGPVGFSAGEGEAADAALATAAEALLPNFYARDLPDVSLNADPNTGYAVYVAADGDYYPNGFDVIGGTSAAAPLWAAFTALVNEARAADSLSVTPGQNPGVPETPVGFINPYIYALGYGSIPGYSKDMHDIDNGSTNQVYVATTGFDDATGWGTYNGGNLLNQLGAVSPGAAPGSAGGTSGSGGSGSGSTGTGGTTVVTGTVTFGGSAPTTGVTATITATSTDGSQTATATTTSTGAYTLSLETGLTYTFNVTATSYVTQSLANVSASASTLTENFALVTASSAGIKTFPVGMQMISEPYDYSTTGLDFAGLFGLTTPIPAGGAALYLWQSEADSYASYPTPPADMIRPGVGYWLYAPSGGLTPVVQGATVSAPFVRTLEPGWNQIGDPFTYAEPLSSMTVAVDSLGTDSGPLLSSGAMVSPTLYAYSPSANAYQAVTGSSSSLQPYAGYWLYAFQETYLTFN